MAVYSRGCIYHQRNRRRREAMTSTLQGKVAIVTGGGAGIGGGIARRLAEDGANVLVADVSAESAKENAATISKEGGWGEAEVARYRGCARCVCAELHWSSGDASGRGQTWGNQGHGAGTLL